MYSGLAFPRFAPVTIIALVVTVLTVHLSMITQPRVVAHLISDAAEATR